MKSPATISALNSMKSAKSNRSSSNGAGTTSLATTFLTSFRNRFEQMRYNLRFAQARRSAYVIFAKRYPDWVSSGFNYRFLTNEAAPILKRIGADASLSLSEELANRWAATTCIAEEHLPETVTKATEIASHFLYILRTELPFHLPVSHSGLLNTGDVQEAERWEVYWP